MSFSGNVNESELDALIDEILQSIPNCDTDLQECFSSADTVDPFPHTRELLLSSYRFDQQRAQLTNCFYNITNVNEQASISYDISYEEAFNDSEPVYKDAAEEEAREAMFEDALNLLSESASFQVESSQEEMDASMKLTDVDHSEGGFNEESINEPILDLENSCNADSISQTECETDTNMEFELNDIIKYFYYKGMENNLE